MPRPRALLFDLGEVVLRLDFSRVLKAFTSASGLSTDEAINWFNRWDFYDTYERGALTEEAFRAELNQRLGTNFPLTEFRDFWNSIIIAEIPGAPELLTKLATQAPLYALTNSNETHIRHVLEHYPWLSTFREIFSSHSIRARKPEPESFHAVFKKTGLEAKNFLFVDDRMENVLAARELGMRAEVVRDSPKDLREIFAKAGFEV